MAFALEMPASGTDEWRKAVDPSALDQNGIGPIHDSPLLHRSLVADAAAAIAACLDVTPSDFSTDSAGITHRLQPSLETDIPDTWKEMPVAAAHAGWG